MNKAIKRTRDDKYLAKVIIITFMSFISLSRTPHCHRKIHRSIDMTSVVVPPLLLTNPSSHTPLHPPPHPSALLRAANHNNAQRQTANSRSDPIRSNPIPSHPIQSHPILAEQRREPKRREEKGKRKAKSSQPREQK